MLIHRQEGHTTEPRSSDTGGGHRAVLWGTDINAQDTTAKLEHHIRTFIDPVSHEYVYMNAINNVSVCFLSSVR